MSSLLFPPEVLQLIPQGPPQVPPLISFSSGLQMLHGCHGRLEESGCRPVLNSSQFHTTTKTVVCEQPCL